MPHHKSTKKRLRQNAVERTYNRSIRTRVRSTIKEARAADAATAGKTLTSAYAELDGAAKKGVIPKRRADRLKSRLALRAKKLA